MLFALVRLLFWGGVPGFPCVVPSKSAYGRVGAFVGVYVIGSSAEARKTSGPAASATTSHVSRVVRPP